MSDKHNTDSNTESNIESSKHIAKYDTLIKDNDLRLQFMFALHKTSTDATNIIRSIFLNESMDNSNDNSDSNNSNNNSDKRFKGFKLNNKDKEYIKEKNDDKKSKNTKFYYFELYEDLQDAANNLYKSLSIGDTITLVEHNKKEDRNNFLPFWYEFCNINPIPIFRTHEEISTVLINTKFQIIDSNHLFYDIETNPLLNYYIEIKK